MIALLERPEIRRLASSLPFRAAVSVAFLAFHLVVLTELGRERFNLPFNISPNSPPAFANGPTDAVPANWDRLIVSRWDAQHYIALALRGYDTCPRKIDLGPTNFPENAPGCQVQFYPGYPFVGRVLTNLFRIPIDYSLFAVSLASSFLLMMLWTSREMTRTFGLGTTYLSLVLLNTFTTGYFLVAVYTEPLALVLTLGSFLLFRKRLYLLAALAAGATGIVRPTGVATCVACALAIVFVTLSSDRPKKPLGWVSRAVAVPLSGWGVVALMGYFQYRFGDPFLYAHAIKRVHGFEASFASALFPSYTFITRSLWLAPNDGIWVGAALFWFALGHRILSSAAPQDRVYWYGLYALTMATTMVGRVQYSYVGSSRYVLLAIPLFFAMANVLRKSAPAAVVWIGLSMMHYWSVSGCYYVGRGQPTFESICNFHPG